MSEITKSRFVRLIVVLCVATFLLAAWLWTSVLDTGLRRTLVAQEIRGLVDVAKQDANNEAVSRQILRLAKGEYQFQAAYATTALGDLGDAAIPIMNEIAQLMNSKNALIRREAARSLAKLGERSNIVLPQLVDKVQNGNPNEDSTWFAALAVGNVGADATRHIPLLKSKIGLGPSQFDNYLRRSIRKLDLSMR